MYDDFGGPGFDWNRNGRHDAFDDYIGMEFTGDSKNVSGKQKKTSGGIVIYDASKDSDGVAIFKALLVCTFCIGGIFLPASAGAGPLGMAMCMLGAVGLSIAVLKI